jgi:hypothetical protein
MYNTNPTDYIKRRIVMFACVYWCPTLCLIVYWCPTLCRIVYWCPTLCRIVYWCPTFCRIVYWCPTLCRIVYWCLTLCRIVYWCPTLCRIVYWCPILCRIIYWCQTLCRIICFYAFVSVLWYPLRCQHKTIFGSFLPPVLCRGFISYVCYLCLFVSSDIQHVLTMSCMAGVLSIKDRSCLLFIEYQHGSPPVFGVCVANYFFKNHTGTRWKVNSSCL